MYDSEAAGGGGGDSGQSFSMEPEPAELAAEAGAPAEDSASGRLELFTSASPVPGNYFRFAPSSTVKYQIAESANTAEGGGAPRYLVVFNDFFESYDKYEQLFQPLLDTLPAGSQMLMFNFPGQAHTEFPAEATLNNAYLAEVASSLLAELAARGRFGAATDVKVSAIAVGNGANIVTYWISKMQTDSTASNAVGVTTPATSQPAITLLPDNRAEARADSLPGWASIGS